ncbi:MAG: DNA-directed RNA polymerase subunit alpha [Parcubacteria group bacterium]|nr:DNA-directed RNA polymerase subunit alpha [Parcubacteria group bacterium]
MSDYNVSLPSKPRIVSEEEFAGTYEIDGLHPGYGHTLGNSLRRIILSSLPGAAITSVKIDGVQHEFSTIEGVKEDIITILLNLKRVRLQMLTEDPQTLTISSKGAQNITAGDIVLPGQVNVLNENQHIAEVTDKNKSLEIELVVEKGLGYIPKEVLQKERVDIGAISLDAIFTPIRRVNYEVENMRVGDRTDFNRLRIFIETDGTVMPKEALERAIEIMINQLRSIVGFKEEELVLPETTVEEESTSTGSEDGEKKQELDKEFMKTRIDSLDLTPRTINALNKANIRTAGGLVRKREEDILSIEGLGQKGLQEVKRALSNFGVTLR